MENKNILFIEDDPAMIKLFELIVKKFGFNVISASNGAEGLKKLNQQEFILVITDLKMPIMNGVEFIKQARKIPKYMNYPFIIVTGNLKEFSADVALLGNLTIMEKPMKQTDIQELLENRLKFYSEEAVPTIKSEEIFTFLLDKTQKISSLVLEIITKSKPELKVLEKIPVDSFFQGNYFSSYLLLFQNQRIGIVFNFDEKISKSIASEIAKEIELKPEIILECLNKVTVSMIKKIPENSPYSTIVAPAIPIGLYGSDTKTVIFGTLKENLIANIYAKTEKGSMVIHLLKL